MRVYKYICSLFFLISVVVAQVEAQNTQKLNPYRYGLVLKFSAKSIHRILSNTHLCQFFTVFPHFEGGSASGDGRTTKKTIGMDMC